MPGSILSALALTAAIAAGTTNLDAATTTAEAAFRRNDHAAIVKALLPAYRSGELSDARALYLLSRGCFFAKPSPLKGALAVFDRSCTRQSGEITRRAAQAGSVEAMLDLTYTLFRPEPVLAHPDLRPDPVQAYGWALLAAALAPDGDLQKRADEKVATLGDALRGLGPARSAPLLARARREAQAFFVKLVAQVRPDLAPADGALPVTGRFRELGWVDIPGTADVHEMKEGPDQLYLPTIRAHAGSVTFHVSLNDVDIWRFAQFDADCATSRIVVLADTDWQGYDDIQFDAVPLKPVARKPWDADATYARMIADFACARGREAAAAR